jgi:rhodanese-related sulfurtransferase
MYQVNEKDHYFVHCAGGYRSVIFASILKSRGIHNITDVKGGYNAIKDTSLERTEFVCPSTL